MLDGVRHDWVDCVCCASGKCCKMNSNEGVPFTPAEGFTHLETNVTNPNVDGCVGRADVEIVLTKPANPPLGCPGTNLGCGASCVNAYDGEGNLAGSRAASTALFNEWLGRFTPPEGWLYNGVGKAVPNAWPFSPACTDLRWEFWGPDADCPGPCAAGTNNLLFRYVPDGELCFATGMERTNWIAGKHTEIQAALNAWYAQQEPLEFQIGDCWYQIKPIGIVSYWPSSARTSCTYNKPSGTPNRYCVCAVNLRYLAAVAWQITCSSSPCTMPDYDWPMVLPCVCTGEYEKPGLASTPDCKLYLDSTRREYKEDKCRFIGRYLGVIAAGQIACPPGTTDPNCKCCGEPTA